MVKQVKQRKTKYPEFDLGKALPDGLVHVKQLAAKFISKKKGMADKEKRQIKYHPPTSDISTERIQKTGVQKYRSQNSVVQNWVNYCM